MRGEMNYVLMLSYNGLALTRDAIESVMAQDVPCEMLVLDDGSTDGTLEYLRTAPRRVRVSCCHHRGVSRLWNLGLGWFFSQREVSSVLVINNDVKLRPDTVRRLITDGSQFVTCVGTSSGADWPGGEPTGSHRPHPDFSCFLIRRECWERVGEFDVAMEFICSDGDYHIRMHQARIEAVSLDLPFWHYASGTLKQSSDEDRDRLLARAETDRVAFRKKWGVDMGSQGYYKLFEMEKEHEKEV